MLIFDHDRNWWSIDLVLGLISSGSQKLALSAGDALEKHLAQIEDSLRTDRWKAILLESSAAGRVIVFWDIENEKPDTMAHYYDPEDADAMQAI